MKIATVALASLALLGVATKPATQTITKPKPAQIAEIGEEIPPHREPPPPPPPTHPAEAPPKRLASTAFCLTGRMANGEFVRAGSVAMNGVRLGTVVEILEGPAAGTYVVRDRIGHGSAVDVWMASCRAALDYGRRYVSVRVVA